MMSNPDMPDKHDYERVEDFESDMEDYFSQSEDMIRSDKEDAIVEEMDRGAHD